jgi:hypothetical protein
MRLQRAEVTWDATPSRMGTRHSSNWPLRSLANTIDSPSGVNVGSISTYESFVSRRRPPRSSNHNITERRKHAAPAVGRRIEPAIPRELRSELVEARKVRRRRSCLDGAGGEQVDRATRLRARCRAPELPIGGVQELG